MYLLQDSFEILNFASKQDLKWDMVFLLSCIYSQPAYRFYATTAYIRINSVQKIPCRASTKNIRAFGTWYSVLAPTWLAGKCANIETWACLPVCLLTSGKPISSINDSEPT